MAERRFSSSSPALLHHHHHHHHFSSSSLRRSALACSTKKTEEARRRSQICAETEEAKRTEETEGDLSRAPLPSDDLLSVSSGSLKPIGWGLGRDDRRDRRRSALHRRRHFLAHRRLVYPALSSTLSKYQDGLGFSGLKSLRALALLGSGSVWRLGFSTVSSADEAEHGLVVADYPWPHNVILSSYDHADLCFQNVYYQMLIFAGVEADLVLCEDLKL